VLVLLAGLVGCAPDHPEAHEANGKEAQVQIDRSIPGTEAEGLSPLPPRFETLTVSDGLVSNEANVFLQDRQGFLWIGTFGGLSRFDGASFTNFLHDPTDSTSLTQNKVNSLFEDRTGAIWVGTNGGLNRFDPETETFTRYRHDPADSTSLSDDEVLAVVEAATGAIWAGTWGGGLNRLDPATGVLTRVYRTIRDPQSLEDEVHALLANEDGTLWVGGSDGLSLYDPSEETFLRVQRGNDDPEVPLLPIVYSLCRDPSGAIWAGTRTEGLFRYNPKTRAVVHYPYAPTTPGAIGNPWVLSMTVDDTGTLWAGTNGAGLYRYDRSSDTFTRFEYDPSNPESLRDNNVLAVFQSRDRVLWVGTYGGLARRYPLSRHVARESVRPGDVRSLYSNAVTAFAESATGTLWVGTDGGGLNRREASSDAGFTRVPYETDRPFSRAATDILSLTLDEFGGLWVGAIGGLYRRDPSTGRFARFGEADGGTENKTMFIYDLDAEDERVLAGAGLGGVLDIEPTEGRSIRTRITDAPEVVTAVLRDRTGQVWAGTYNEGLWRRTEKDGGLRLRRVPLALSSQQVNTLYEDRTGALWIGTGDGLDRLTIDGADTTLTRFHRADGLPDTVIRGLLEDRQGRLWVATSTGLSWRDPQTGTFVSYDERDGMVMGGPLYRSPRTGRIYVGGNSGYAHYDPEAVTVEPPPPAPVLTGLRVLGDPVRIGGNGAPLQRALSMTDELRLRYDDRVVAVTFAALDFRAPSKHRYAVRLDGFDNDWRKVEGQREATFTNLSPGRYTFRVRAAGRDGVWGGETALAVTVVPPWWRTWWAYGAYALLVVLGIGVVDRIQRRRLTQRERERAHLREAQIHADEAEKRSKALQQVDAMKSHFFANVSHEFRTPLALTLGPLEDIKAGLYGPLTAPLAEQVDLARRNAIRVLDLINQILDISRLEAGRTPLRAQALDLGAFIEDVAEPFRALAERKEMTFEVNRPTTSVEAFADPPQLEKVLANLLSNALKFTPEGGTVRVSLTVAETSATVKVRDNGPGIPTADLPHVFDRFYRVGETAQTQLGTGIGLALAKEIMHLHSGTLTVESEEGFGSSFLITLPLGRSHLAPGQIVEDAGSWKSDGSPPALSARPAMDDPSGETPDTPPAVADVTTVLVVEDHADMRAYVHRHLASDYRVLEAADGEAGLALARKHLPDLVLSDVMMPGMDGFALCHALKSDRATDFIPVLLLTAKAAPEDKLKGLGELADDYLTKPFDPVELRARIANLIAVRTRLRERFRQDGMAPELEEDASAPTVLSAQEPITSADEAFLEQVHEAVEAHLSDETFSVERLAEAVGMSRGHLHRKLTSLAGQPPSDLIRTARLERAALLLAGGAGTVSEIAYAVGFKSVGHFSDSFLAAHGSRPSDYASSAETGEDETG
jgi:signal transduction histidine kinase/ligand-binding sensor domain-containing protein/DNA-binding response OmpR family regulator